MPLGSVACAALVAVGGVCVYVGGGEGVGGHGDGLMYSDALCSVCELVCIHNDIRRVLRSMAENVCYE